jgi:hypothetical protein
MHGTAEKFLKNLIRNLKEKHKLGDLDIDERIILKYLIEIGCDSVDWIHLP